MSRSAFDQIRDFNLQLIAAPEIQAAIETGRQRERHRIRIGLVGLGLAAYLPMGLLFFALVPDYHLPHAMTGVLEIGQRVFGALCALGSAAMLIWASYQIVEALLRLRRLKGEQGQFDERMRRYDRSLDAYPQITTGTAQWTRDGESDNAVPAGPDPLATAAASQGKRRLRLGLIVMALCLLAPLGLWTSQVMPINTFDWDYRPLYRTIQVLLALASAFVSLPLFYWAGAQVVVALSTLRGPGRTSA